MRRWPVLGASLLLALGFSVTVAASPGTTDLMGEQWRVYNGKPATTAFWDINKLRDDAIPIQQFDSTTTGSFAIYVLNNYNVDLTDKTLKTSLAWTLGTYRTRSTEFPGAYVRFEFQDTTAGAYDSNDYWWCTISLDLNAGTSGQLLASLADRTLWTNQSGKSATDHTEGWLEWQGDIVHMSPYDGFTKAMKNVKQLGLSFGSSGSYASGVALVGRTGTVTMTAFTVTP